MSTLAHVFEAAGIATIVLSSNRSVTERMKTPRALNCDFPLGRPLGKPNDAEFQHGVLSQAFGLLDAEAGPVVDDHPEVIVADETAMTCQIPPGFDPSLPPAVDEAKGMRKAYDRAVEARGSTGVGRSIDADGVPDALGILHAIAEGAPWKDAGIPGGNTTALCHDIRTYYEEAGLELVGALNGSADVPDGRAAEAWFYESTEAGKTVMAARQAIKDQDGPFPAWFYMSPGHR